MTLSLGTEDKPLSISTLVSVTGWAWGGLEWTSGPFLWFLAGRVQEGQLCSVFSRLCLSTQGWQLQFLAPTAS